MTLWCLAPYVNSSLYRLIHSRFGAWINHIHNYFHICESNSKHCVCLHWIHFLKLHILRVLDYFSLPLMVTEHWHWRILSQMLPKHVLTVAISTICVSLGTSCYCQNVNVLQQRINTCSCILPSVRSNVYLSRVWYKKKKKKEKEITRRLLARVPACSETASRR